MIRIGDFARLARLSVETLRHYDELRILVPARVDQFTGYRFYDASQLARVHRILALKDLGFSLRQIATALDEVTVDQLAGMLKLARAQSEHALAEESTRLDRIDARLRRLESEESMSNYEVVLKQAPAMTIASCRVTVPSNDQVARVLGAAFDAAYAAVRAEGAKETGPCLAIWHQPAAVLANEDVEAAVQVERQFAGTESVLVYEVPGTQVAAVVHEGPFAEMERAHAVLLSWIEENGYRSNETYREIYVRDDHGGGQDPVVEIQYPVERAG